jgi:hypothetical protein
MSAINEQMLRIYREYRKTHGNGPVNMGELYDWARQTGRWEPQPSAMRRQFSEQMSQAMRQDYFTDEQGRKVRAKHAVVKEVNGKQMSFWGDLRQESEAFMKLSFSQRRKQITSDCRQLKTDVDSFNENRKPKELYQLVLDFTEDVAEMVIAATIQKTLVNVPKQPSGRSRASVPVSVSQPLTSRP